jgi:hypothetical protein
MATYCLSIHDLRLLLRQKEEIADCWLLDADTEQLDSGDSERDNTADSCSLDTDSDRIDPDDNEETESIELNRQNVVEVSKCCLGTQTKGRRQRRIDASGERECRSGEEERARFDFDRKDGGDE